MSGQAHGRKTKRYATLALAALALLAPAALRAAGADGPLQNGNSTPPPTIL